MCYTGTVIQLTEEKYPTRGIRKVNNEPIPVLTRNNTVYYFILDKNILYAME